MESNNFNHEILLEDNVNYDIMFKVIVIGDSFVGKSCLTIKATKNIFPSDYLSTIGFEVSSFVSKIEDKVVKLQIWDTCGQEIYRSLISNYYRNSAGAIVMFAFDK